MAVWSITIPADTDLANTIHTAIQNTRIDVMDLIQCNDGTIDAHIFQTSATGRHEISAVGWAKNHASTAAMLSWLSSNTPGDGTLHIDNYNTMSVTRKNKPIIVTSVDHGQLLNLDDDNVHTQYLKKDGTRAFTGDVTLTGTGQLSANTFGTGTTTAMPATHHTQSWFAAHGADAVAADLLADDSVPKSRNLGSTLGATSKGQWTVVTQMYFWPKMYKGNSSYGDLAVTRSNNVTVWTLSNAVGNFSNRGYITTADSRLV